MLCYFVYSPNMLSTLRNPNAVCTVTRNCCYHHGRMKAAESRKKKNTVCPAVLEKQSTSDAGDYKMALCTFWHIFLTQSAMQWELGTRRLQVRHGKFVPIECQLQVPGKITDYNLISRGVTRLFCREF